jgi:protein-L-isoaspartate(D-aspartate) O-methyltransferase
MTSGRRQELVQHLVATRGIRSAEVRRAFLHVPREAFVPDVAATAGIEAVYRDEALPTKLDEHGDAISSSSQPQIMASMLEELRVQPGHRVLEIGAGTGYNAALLSELVGDGGEVTSVEIDGETARAAEHALRTTGHRVTIVEADGRRGWEAGAPYDRIIVTASSADVPRAFIDQLADGGLLVLPLRLTDAIPFHQIVVTFERVGDRLLSTRVIRGGFMRLRDRAEDPSLPWAISKVVENRDGRGSTLATLSGSTWGSINDEDRQRLLAMFLSPPRSRKLPVRLSGWRLWELETFLCIAASEDLLVGCSRRDLDGLLFFGPSLPGLTDPGRSSLAHLAGGRSVSRLDAYGDADAEDLLAELVDEWRLRGEPRAEDLIVEVAFGRPEPRTWVTRRRGESVIGLGYRPIRGSRR